MSKLLLRLALSLGALALALAFFLVPVRPVTSNPGPIYLDFEVPDAPGVMKLALGEIPPNGSPWHELHPAYCGTWVQEDYQDNGDGVVSACDVITFNGMAYHITWAGPTYFTTCEVPGLPPEPAVFEPIGDPTGIPICQIWHQIWPVFCSQIHITDWTDDNGSGQLDECDFVYSHNAAGQARYHIDRIGLNVVIEPGTVPTERSTWGLIKQFFRG